MIRSLLLLPFLAACSSTASDPQQPGTDAGTTGAALTYHENVEGIVQEKCQSCHRPGGIGPFSLMTYDEVKAKAAFVADQVKTRAMPPWGAFETAECKPRHPLYRDLGLIQGDVDTITKWVEQGAQRGNPSKAPAPKTFKDLKLEDVTHTATMAPHLVKPANKDEHVCFSVNPGITEDAYFDGIAVTVGNTKVVHHVLVYTDPMSQGPAKAAEKGFYDCFGGPGVANTTPISGWVPGTEPTNYPAGVGLKLTKGMKLVIQLHYHPTASDETDATKVELRTAKSTPTWEANMRMIGNARSAPILLPGASDPASGAAFLIPAGAKSHVEEMLFTLPVPKTDVRIAGVTAHMHWAGKDMKVEIERANPTATDPAKECLIQTPNYDFNWQRAYAYNATVDQLPRLANGDKLRIRCTYDNSMDNPHIAKALAEQKMTSPKDVTLGEDTLDEMCLPVFTFYAKL